MSYLPGSFLPGDSVAHRMDPRAKAGMLLVLAVGIMAGRGWPGSIMVTVLGFAAVLALGISPRGVLRGLRPFLWLIGLTVALHLLIAEDIRAGLDSGATYGLRLFAVIWFSTLFTLTTSPLDLIRGFKKSFGPLGRLGVPVEELAVMLLIFIRMLPTIQEEARRISEAQAARFMGREPGTWSFRLKKTKALVMPLFYNTLRRVEGLALAVSLRGLGSPGRSRVLEEMRFRFADYTGLGLAALVAVLSVRF